MSDHNFWCAVMAVIVLVIGVGLCLIGWWSERKSRPRPLTRRDDKRLAKEHDRQRGYDRPREVRAREAAIDSEGAPTFTVEDLRRTPGGGR